MQFTNIEIEDLASYQIPSHFLVQTLPEQTIPDPEAKKKRRKVSRACESCRKSHVSCDDTRPCKRCTLKGTAHLCIDSKPPKSTSANTPSAAATVTPATISSLNSMMPMMLNPYLFPLAENFNFQSMAIGGNVAMSGNVGTAENMERQESLGNRDGMNIQEGLHNMQIDTMNLNGQSLMQQLEAMNQLEGSNIMSQIDGSRRLQQMQASNLQMNSQNQSLGQSLNNLSNQSGQSTPNSVTSPLAGQYQQMSNQQQATSKVQSPIGQYQLMDNQQQASSQIQSPAGQNQETFSFKSLAPINHVLSSLNLEASVSCHIIYLVKQLASTQSFGSGGNNLNSDTQMAATYSSSATQRPSSVGSYISILAALPSTPSVVFSPSGVVFTCNQAFASLVQTPITHLLSGKFCVYAFMDMPSMLSVLDMAIKFKGTSQRNESQGLGFGRCSLECGVGVGARLMESVTGSGGAGLGSRKVKPDTVVGPSMKRLCAVSVSTTTEADSVWIVAQFIPI
jgi:Fungal Zn(2)-Cys(6) binuclear cluster domain